MELPEGSNFFANVLGEASAAAIARLYAAAGWRSRKCSWTDYEVTSEVAELIIEGDPALLHGSVADPVHHGALVLKPLREASIAFACECYAPDGSILFAERWIPDGDDA